MDANQKRGMRENIKKVQGDLRKAVKKIPNFGEMRVYRGSTRIIGARWTKRFNLLKMSCGRCNAIFEHRADRWTIRCPSCGKQAGLGKVREAYARSNRPLTNTGGGADEKPK